MRLYICSGEALFKAHLCICAQQHSKCSNELFNLWMEPTLLHADNNCNTTQLRPNKSNLMARLRLSFPDFLKLFSVDERRNKYVIHLKLSKLVHTL